MAESHAVLTAALSIQRKLLGDDHPDVLATLRSFGLTLEGEGKLEEAEKVKQEVLTRWRKQAANDHPQVLEAVDALTHVLVKRKKLAEAEEVLREALLPDFVRQPASAKLLA